MTKSVDIVSSSSIGLLALLYSLERILSAWSEITKSGGFVEWLKAGFFSLVLWTALPLITSLVVSGSHFYKALKISNLVGSSKNFK